MKLELGSRELFFFSTDTSCHVTWAPNFRRMQVALWLTVHAKVRGAGVAFIFRGLQGARVALDEDKTAWN